MFNRPAFLIVGLLIAAVAGFGAPVRAETISFIRDAEIESTIPNYSTPLFEAVGLDAAAVEVHLINSKRLNAFVAGGQKLFLNTGLLMAAESPNQVIGVIAHETGHIAGGHLARTHDAMRNANITSILAFVLGTAAAVAGSPDAGMAVMAGGSALAQSTLLKYSRTQEQAADQFAVNALDSTGQSSRGLLEFLRILERQEALVSGRENPYLRTHPLAGDRIAFVGNHVANSPYSNVPSPADQIVRFARMKAKLMGFIDPGAALKAYPEDDTSLDARYARAIAHYRRPDLPRAFAEIDSLIAEFPGDGFFLELKGQILFENGYIDDAVLSYGDAVAALPDEPLIRVGLARALVESGRREALDEAVHHLEIVVRQDSKQPQAWHLLSIAYGRTDRLGLSWLASAQRAMLTGRPKDALEFATRANKMLPNGSPGQLRAQDIEFAAKNVLNR